MNSFDLENQLSLAALCPRGFATSMVGRWAWANSATLLAIAITTVACVLVCVSTVISATMTPVEKASVLAGMGNAAFVVYFAGRLRRVPAEA